MINYIRLIFFFILLHSCSFHDAGGFWTKEKELDQDGIKFISVLKKEKENSKEFNQDLKITLNIPDKIDQNAELNNDDGYIIFKSSLQNITKYNFSKIKNYNLFEPNLTFDNQNIIFFDNKGTILKFDDKSKLIWKTNIYSKDEKRSGPLPTMIKKNDQLIIADNLANLYSINIENGNEIWKTKNQNPFNSQIKIYKDKFFVVDSNNNLNCFSTINGNLIWSYKTEKSFINSFKKLSILIKDNIIVFNNSIGDITAVNLNSGSLIWQISTQNSKIYEDIMKFKTSTLIENENSIYFSNNINKFYSIDLATGALNWIQSVNSDLRPAVVGNFIFTISLDGYFFIIEKKTGNIIRVTNLFNELKLNKKKFYSTGFVMNSEELFVSTSLGKLLVVDLQIGRIKNVLKIDNKKISRAFVKNQNMYLIRDNSVIKIN